LMHMPSELSMNWKPERPLVHIAVSHKTSWFIAFSYECDMFFLISCYYEERSSSLSHGSQSYQIFCVSNHVVLLRSYAIWGLRLLALSTG
jgi:hypothetical protein